MKRLLLTLGTAVLLIIPITSLLVLFEVVTFPNAHRWDGYFVAGYLALVLILLGRKILAELYRRYREWTIRW